jgi:hypothetical protein
MRYAGSSIVGSRHQRHAVYVTNATAWTSTSSRNENDVGDTNIDVARNEVLLFVMQLLFVVRVPECWQALFTAAFCSFVLFVARLSEAFFNVMTGLNDV